jgi:hypothetical protein
MTRCHFVVSMSFVRASCRTKTTRRCTTAYTQMKRRGRTVYPVYSCHYSFTAPYIKGASSRARTCKSRAYAGTMPVPSHSCHTRNQAPMKNLHSGNTTSSITSQDNLPCSHVCYTTTKIGDMCRFVERRPGPRNYRHAHHTTKRPESSVKPSKKNSSPTLHLLKP